MKKIVFVVFTMAAAVASANTTWYRNCNMNSSNAQYLQKLSVKVDNVEKVYWKDSNGTAGTGDVSATDDLVLNGSFSGSNPLRLRTPGISFKGNSLAIGEVGGTANELCQDGGSFTFSNEGLKLCNGNWFINGNGPGKFNIAGPITVYSPASAPFLFHVGQDQYSNNVSRFTGTLTGAKGMGLLFGNYNKSLSSAKCATFELRNIDNYAGTLTARVKATTGFTGNDYHVRLLLAPGTASAAGVVLYNGCEVGVNGTAGTMAIDSLDFKSDSGMYVTASSSSAPCIAVTNSYSQAGTVRVKLTGAILVLFSVDFLPILRVPLGATFTGSDFTLTGGDERLELVARDTATAHELCLTGVDSKKIWFLKAEVTTSGNYIPGDLSYFQDLGGVVGSGAPTSNDRLVVPGGGNNPSGSSCNYRMRTNCGNFTGYSMQIGNGENGADIVVDANNGTRFAAAAGTEGFLLAKGEFFFNANGSFTIDGPIKVLDSTANEPFAFVYGNYTYSNRTSKVIGPIVGGERTRLTFGMETERAKASSAPLATFLVDDVVGYSGALESCNFLGDNVGSYFGARLLVAAQTTPAKAVVKKGGEFGVSGGGVLSVKSLALKGTARLYVGGTNGTVGCVAASEGFAFENGIPVNFNVTVTGSGLQRLPILTVPLASAEFTAADVMVVKGANCLNDDLTFEVDTDTEAGTRTLYAVAVGIVKQVKSLSGRNGNGTGTAKESDRDWCYFSSLTNGASWSDGSPVHSGSHYYTAMAFHTLYEGGGNLQTDYEFPGLSLTLAAGGKLMSSAKSFQVPELICEDGSLVQLTMEAATVSRVVATNIVLSGSVQAICHQGRALVFDGPIRGSGTLTLAGSSGTSDPTGKFELRGDNSVYLGKIILDMYEYRAQYISFDKVYPTLFVNAGASLGGALAAFEPRAFTLRGMGRLSVTNRLTAVTLDAANRGVYVYDCGRFYTDSGAKLTVDEPLLLNGTMWKEGAGALTLGGAMSHEVEAGGAISDTPVLACSNRFIVAGGSVFAGHVDALRGLETVFTNSATFGVRYDPANADLLRYGARNVCVDQPFALAAGKTLTLRVDAGEHDQPTNGTKVGIATVKSTAADAVEALLTAAVKERGWPMSRQVLMRDDNGDNTVTFSLRITTNGSRIYLR